MLNAMTDKAFLAALNDAPSLKTGRPRGPDTTSASGKETKSVLQVTINVNTLSTTHHCAYVAHAE